MNNERTLAQKIGVVITHLNNLHCTAEVLVNSICGAPVDFDLETISNVFGLFADNIQSATEALEIIYEEMPCNLYDDTKGEQNASNPENANH